MSLFNEGDDSRDPSDASLMLAKQRQRKFHRRSRNGCVNCKKRHIRCDEARPSCSSCQRSSGECVYPDPFVAVATIRTTSTGSTSQEQPSKAPDAQALVKVTGARKISGAKSDEGSISGGESSTGCNDSDDGALTLVGAPPHLHMFTGFPIELPEQSRWLFHRFTQFAQERVGPGSHGPQESFLIHKALSDPGYLHSALLQTGLYWVWRTKSINEVNESLLHHKSEACRYLNQQLANPSKASSDAIIATISNLALLEASFFSVNADALSVAVAHLQGLEKVVDYFSGPIDLTQLTLFQRTLKMAINSILQGEIITHSTNVFYDDKDFQPLPMIILFMALFPTPNATWWKDELADAGKPYFRGPQNPGASTPGWVSGKLPTRTEDLSDWYKTSRSSFIACYLYLALTLRRGTMSSYVLNWLIDQFILDAERLEQGVVEGKHNRGAYFWSVMLSASAVASVEWSTELERHQIAAWTRTFDEKIRVVSETMKLTTWAAAQEALGRMGWIRGFDGEDDIRAIWERATHVGVSVD